GTAVQGVRILSASGFSIDTLDYGLASRSHHRGVLLSRGLALFRAGLIDQHFNTFHGRLARLARTLMQTETPLGFGIEEHTAMPLGPDGIVEVVGASGLTVVDASRATLSDGPLGVNISGVRLCYLEGGDAFDTKTGRCRIHPDKPLIARGDEGH